MAWHMQWHVDETYAGLIALLLQTDLLVKNKIMKLTWEGAKGRQCDTVSLRQIKALLQLYEDINRSR